MVRAYAVFLHGGGTLPHATMSKDWLWSTGPRSRRSLTLSVLGLGVFCLPLQAAAAAAPAPALAPLARSDSIDRSGRLSLGNIREALIRQEDTIIFSLIERAQFALNAPVYQQDGVPVPGFTAEGRRYSPLEYLLRETEQLHGKIRRYTSPDEHAFYPDDLPALVLPPISYASVLAPFSKEINLNARVLNIYVERLLPNITAPGDDSNYGSSAMYDVLSLQALSKRVHYGKFVAEAKFLEQRQKYTELIKRGDSKGIMELLTNKAVEQEVIARVRQKAAMFGRDYTAEGPADCVGDGQRFKIDPSKIAALFEDWVMPLTKDIEVLYLLRRLEWNT